MGLVAFVRWEDAPVFLLLLLSLGTAGYYYHRWGRRHQVSVVASTKELETELRPAEANWILAGGKLHERQVVGTFLDLARRGYYAIEVRDSGFFVRSPLDMPSPTELTRWEAMFLEAVRVGVSDGEAELREVFKKGKMSLKSGATLMDKLLRGKGWFDKETRDRRAKLLIKEAGFLFPTVFLGLLVNVSPAPFMVVCGAQLLLAGLAPTLLERPSPEGERLRRGAKVYKEHLKGSGGAGEVGNPELSVVYASALGLSKSEIKELVEALGEQLPDGGFGWFVAKKELGRGELAECMGTICSGRKLLGNMFLISRPIPTGPWGPGFGAPGFPGKGSHD